MLLCRTGTYQVDMLTKIQINIVLNERNLEETIETILDAAYTEEPGDGLLFVYPVEEVIRVQTRERVIARPVRTQTFAENN